MPPRMRLPSRVLHTSSTCVPSSTPSPADVRKTANGVHNPPTTGLKPRFTISFPLKNVFDRPNTMKPRTSTDSPSLPADENHLPNRLPNFAIQSVICVDIRRFNFVLLWDCSMKKNCVPCMKQESPVITVIWKLPRLIFQTLLYAYARTETGYSRCSPSCRHGYLLRRYHRHGRNDGTTD